jgi:hypothetical protein
MIDEPIFYVANDVSRGLGLEKLLPNYHLICVDEHPLVDYLIEAGVKVFCLERILQRKNIIFRNSGKLLERPEVEQYIKENSGGKIPNIVYFKPSPKIDALCQKKGYRQLGNRVTLNHFFEDKVSFFKFCQQLKFPIPPGEIIILGETNFENLKEKYGPKMVIQFGRGWAGSTTFFVQDEEQFNRLKRRFGKNWAKISKFIAGKTILNNACVTRKEVLVGPPAEQLTAISGFTAREGGTCGRVWPARIDKKKYRDIEILSERVGEQMRKKGYLGYFGLDFLLEEGTGKIYLSENNARMTASATFFSKLEIRNGRVPLMLYHVGEFIGEKFKSSKAQKFKVEGSEVVMRNEAPKPVLVRGNFRPGVYRLRGDRLEFVREACDIDGVRNQEEFFLTAAGMDRVVNPEIELVRLNSLSSVLDNSEGIAIWVKMATGKVKQELDLKGVSNGNT